MHTQVCNADLFSSRLLGQLTSDASEQLTVLHEFLV